MGFADDYFALTRKKKKDKDGGIAVSESTSFEREYARLMDEGVSESASSDYYDIAPVANTSVKDAKEEEDKKDLFGLDFVQKGVFDDGYQFGDITKTILGTTGDAAVGIVKGLSTVAEGLGDLASYGVAGVADIIGEDDFAQRLRKSTAENLTDEFFGGATDYLDKYSVLGDTSEAIMQGVGQVGVTLATGGLGAAAGLGTVGASVLTAGTMFASSFGGGMSEAYQGGASDEDALKYGALKGAVDAGTEWLFGGLGKSVKALGVSKGISSLDDVFAKKLSSKISSQFWSNAAEFGVKASAEGVEEVLAGIGAAVGKNLTYMSDEELTKLVEDENLLEQFVVGAVTSGIAQGGDFVSSVKKGQDFITGLTENEQKVIDKEYENRLAEKEQSGEKLDNKAKNKLYDAVMNDFEKGYISTDTIEETLGGDTYKTYKDTIDSEDAQIKELEAQIKELEAAQNTVGNAKKYDALTAQLEELKNNSQRDQLKAQLGDEVFSIAKDSRLVESYNERARRGMAYEADLSKYDTKQQAVIQKAIDSGILNNTNRTHEFVDMVAKISADKGVLFDFTDNAKLKESGFAINGAQVNGYVTKDGVTLNIDSAKSLNSVVGHEITHILEGTELYTELQSVLFEYAKSKKDYQSRYDALAALYKNVKDADIDAELTADLVGDYLFTDSDFISRLSTEHRNVFQKIYDEVKYLLKVATAGSAEARELEKVKRAFDKAYKESGKAKGDTKYSLSSMGTTFFGNENMSIEEFTAEDYKRTTGYQNYVNECLNNYKQSRGEMYDEAVARKEIEDGIDGIVRVAIAAKKAGYDIFDDGVKRSKTDSKNRLLFSSLEPNSDYFTSNDISTICDKRQNFADIYDDIVRAEEAKGVPQGKRFFDNIDNYFYLHGILASKGLTQPCRQCYVESMRKNLAPMASAFLRLVNETDANNTTNDQLYQQKGKNKGALKTNNAALRERVLEILTESEMSASDLTVEMLTTEDGLAQLKITAPLVYEAFNSFYGQSKPKMPKSATPFRFGELTALLTKDDGTINERLVKKINATGGFRLQSYSDFQIQNYTDVLQVIFEAGTLGLSGHAYTKVPAFLEATEGTNLKRNISIFMYKDGNEWKLDRNDSFPYTLEEIYDIVNADKSGNTGIIAVSQNEDMSAWIMANDNIAYGIPFHKSGLKMGTVRDTIVKDGDREIKGYSGTKDHTRQQTEVWAKTTADHKALTKVKDGINIYEFWDFDNKGNLPKNKLIEKNVKRYINECEKAGYLPKFREYVINNDKVLNSTLAYAKELGFVPQDATIEDISFKHKGYTIPYGYYKFLGDFGMFTPDGKASPHEALSLKEYDFDKAVKFFEDSETLRRNEILQQFANDGERQKYAESDLTAADLLELIKQKRVSVVDEVMSRYDAPTRNSLSAEGEAAPTYGNYNVRGKEIALETAQEIAPVQEDVAPVQDSVQDAVQVTTPKDEADELISAIMDEEFRLQGYDKTAEPDTAPTTEEEANALAVKNLRRMTDADAPMETESTYYGDQPAVTADDPFSSRNWHERGTKAFITENPDAKRFFQEEAQRLADDFAYTMPAERGFSGEQYYNTNGEKGFYGWSRKAADDINTLIDIYGLSYAQINEGLDAIINDTDKVNNKPAKTIEFILNDRMLKGYETFYSGEYVAPNQGYIEWLNGQRQAEEYSEIAKTITDADAPMVDDVAPVMKSGTSSLVEIANNGRRDNLKGAYTQDGKQYIADGSFIAEFNTVDDSLATAKDFPAKKVLAELNEAEARQTEGNYSIDGDAVAALNNGTRNFIKVGDSLFDAKYVDAIISAIDSPVFTMSNVHGGDNALFVTGSNGRAVLMPVRASDDVKISYEAKPITEAPITDSLTVEDVMPIADAPVAEKYEAIKPKAQKEPRMVRADNAEQQTAAKVLSEEPKVDKKKRSLWSMAKELVFDNGMVFEDIAKKNKNRDLEAKWNFIRYAEKNAQHFIKNGASGVKSLDTIREQVERTGKTQQFYEYLYHNLNVDRMTLEDRYEDTPNKAVFGDAVTADTSRQAVSRLEKANPQFKRFANDVYAYMNHLRSMMVENGVISPETADLWAEMYPHYVPIRRVGDNGLNINVPLDTGRTGVNAPIKRATGGNSDILPLFDTMGQRTIQTFRAVAKNSFGVELKNTLGTAIESNAASVDDVIDSVDAHEELLQEGKNGQKPTFTVFENGEKVTFEITDEMYAAMKPTSDTLAYTNKTLNKVNDIRRGLLTEYNPTFLLTNALKDAQDVLINSQHPAKTYARMPQAMKELSTKGKWYAEYMANGGEQNSYFDNDTNTFKEENATMEALKKWTGIGAISNANNFIERIPRLAEYIASREAGASIEVAMLDAARVTTNFAAGGKLTKMLNRNGFTFLNASMQGAVQQVRNIREAKMKGFKGWAGLAAKYAVAGLAASILNHLLWDDDEEYEELSDYVKDNYYIVAKYGDGQFVRIPKGRAVAVIQSAFEQMENLVTGEDEVDLGRFTELVVNNLAPNNPLDNNLLAPIMQAWSNTTWYGDDLVPTRLQDLPSNEQYDETTDSISRWLGEKTPISPYKWNYLLDQYSGGVGDMILPMLTPAAERGDTTGAGNLIAPFKDKFSTDGVMKNQNVSDFYDKVDELTVNANASNATDEDVLKSKYINSVSADIGDLYKQKREVQNSDLPDDEKYAAVRELQEQINALAENSLNTYENVNVDGVYATVGDRHYRWYEPSEDSDAEAGWQKISGKQLEKQEKVTSGLGISPSAYWSNKEEYDYAYEYPDKYAVAKAVGGYTAYKGYSSELYDIKADKDADGKSISGSRKEKVIEYINNLNADYGERIILFKSEYNADDTYNYDIIEYLNSRDDISYDEMVAILKELGFTVTADGSIYW